VKQLSLLEHARLRFPQRPDAYCVERVAAETLQELDEHPPVSLEVVASYRGIGEIKLAPLPVAGCLIPVGGQLVMRLRRDDSPRRRRFTGFHEVGHSFLPGYRVQISQRCASPSAVPRAADDPEALSDVAAAQLLLPEHFFANDLVDTPFGWHGITALAEAYEASLLATAYRAVRYWPEPMLLIVLEPGLRKQESGHPDAVPRLRVRSSFRSGPWPFIPKNKSAGDGGPLDRALAGELVNETATLQDLGISDSRLLELSARAFPYRGDDGEIRQRVLAVYRPRQRQRIASPRTTAA
jgi:hypothetical protein